MLARGTERAVGPLTVAPHERVRRLRQRVPAHDLEAEPRLDLELVLALGRRSGVAAPDRVVGVVGARRLAHEDLEHRADAVELGRAERARVVEKGAAEKPGRSARLARAASEPSVEYAGALMWNSGSDVISRSSS